jgi:hypothetical protein
MNALHSTYKKYTYAAGVLGALACVLAFGGFQTADAQTEVNASAGVSAQVQAHSDLRKDAKTDIKNMRGAAQAERKDIRQMGSSTRQSIMEERGTSTRMLRDNRASTTEAMRDNRASTTASIQANREALMKNIQDRRDTLKKQIDAKKGEKKQRLDDKKRNTVNTALQTIFSKLSAKISRLTSIDNRLNSKIAELRTKNVDVTEAASLLATAKVSLAKAQVDVQATRSVAIDQAATSTSKAILQGLITTAETSITASAEAYKKVAQSLKEYLVPPTADASMTVSASTSVSGN